MAVEIFAELVLGWTAEGGRPYVGVAEELAEQAVHMDVALPALAG